MGEEYVTPALVLTVERFALTNSHNFAGTNLPDESKASGIVAETLSPVEPDFQYSVSFLPSRAVDCADVIPHTGA